MQLSEHFARQEFECSGAMPDEVVPSYVVLCRLLLEVIRAHYGMPLLVTSGYRSPGENIQAHGVPDSQHVATAQYCAADWYVPNFHHNMRPVFDYIRHAALPFDQVILEHGRAGDIIHLSWSTTPRRQALEGATYNQSAYQSWDTDIVA